MRGFKEFKALFTKYGFSRYGYKFPDKISPNYGHKFDIMENLAYYTARLESEKFKDTMEFDAYMCIFYTFYYQFHIYDEIICRSSIVIDYVPKTHHYLNLIVKKSYSKYMNEFLKLDKHISHRFPLFPKVKSDSDLVSYNDDIITPMLLSYFKKYDLDFNNIPRLKDIWLLPDEYIKPLYNN